MINNKIPFKLVPSMCPARHHFAVELTGRFVRNQVFLWSTSVKESATALLKFLYGLCSRLYCSVWSWLFKVKERRIRHGSIWKEVWQSVSVPQCKQAETAVWHHQVSSNSLQLQTAVSNRRATGTSSSKHLHYNRRVVLMETSKNSLWHLSSHKSKSL